MTIEICSVCGEHTVGPLWRNDEEECRQKIAGRKQLLTLLGEHPGVPQAVSVKVASCPHYSDHCDCKTETNFTWGCCGRIVGTAHAPGCYMQPRTAP